MTYDKNGNVILCPELYKLNPKTYQVVTAQPITEDYATTRRKRTKTESKKDNYSL